LGATACGGQISAWWEKYRTRLFNRNLRGILDNNATERAIRSVAVGRNYALATIMCSPPLPAAA
jgi:hypothetical protein